MICFLPAPLNPSGVSLRSRNTPPSKYLGSVIYNMTLGVCLFLLLHDFDVHEFIWVLSHHLPASFFLNIHPQSPEEWRQRVKQFLFPCQRWHLCFVCPSPLPFRDTQGTIWEDLGRDEHKACTAGSPSEQGSSPCIRLCEKSRDSSCSCRSLIQRQLMGARASAWIFKISPGLCAVSCTYKLISGLRPVPQ